MTKRYPAKRRKLLYTLALISLATAIAGLPALTWTSRSNAEEPPPPAISTAHTALPRAVAMPSSSPLAQRQDTPSLDASLASVPRQRQLDGRGSADDEGTGGGTAQGTTFPAQDYLASALAGADEAGAGRAGGPAHFAGSGGAGGSGGTGRAGGPGGTAGNEEKQEAGAPDPDDSIVDLQQPPPPLPPIENWQESPARHAVPEPSALLLLLAGLAGLLLARRRQARLPGR